ncbi:hypothetical protein [Methylobacterium brachythecii]|uniref:HTH HARE-type domain-containing protein n=1 Tax=Methylobacterium brachythecii TaxID=1176177 RepID=A0A7W6AIC7_9HYPH|nr:hypothetical protein [Methylobacterium brachythecii]MBB3902906.1 hypothetical protein [Methylobacterium brachythecii]GLS43833.1 hypothetical protein GCM10007884_18180 [Methylobacterium brachythecii]
MVLSEAEAEAQLMSLRRQREVLDRAIADLTLYLELGRRLTTEAAVTSGDAASSAVPRRGAAPDVGGLYDGAVRGAGHTPPDSPSIAPGKVTSQAGQMADTSTEAQLRAAPPVPSSRERNPLVSPAVSMHPAFQPPRDTAEGALSEGVLARRYGRALIEAALDALQNAGRPLHASEILAVLTSQGFSLPGHDPVAALNTRLWKRSGSGGPLKRMGEAVYALVEPEED